MNGTEARIYLTNLEHNIRHIQKIIGNAKLCVSVKANAYGHGDVAVAEKALSCGAEYISVASVEEGSRLRERGISAPILLFGLTIPEKAGDVIRLKLTPFVCDREYIDTLDAAASRFTAAADSAMRFRFPVHLKIDTGMGRIGCRPEKAAALAEYICKTKHLYLEGVCTHFCVSDSFDKSDVDFTEKQIDLFSKSADDIKKAGIEPGLRHCSASGGILMYPHAHFDMVRAGILTYGYSPVRSAAEYTPADSFNLKPVMELSAPIVALKTVRAGESVSYGRTWTAPHTTRIATLPIGYGDGLPRGLSSRLKVTVGGKNYPIVGRICMDQCMADVGTDESIHRWDRAYIFGPGEGCQTAADVAALQNTIHYEIITGISARVPRVYVS